MQVCNDWTVDSEEWCVQLWGCSSGASDWEEACWSYYASWPTESCDLGEFVSLVSFTVIICIPFLCYVLFSFFLFISSLSDLALVYNETHFYRPLQGWAKTKLNSVWIQNWRENFLLKELLRSLFFLSLTHVHELTLVFFSSSLQCGCGVCVANAAGSCGSIVCAVRGWVPAKYEHCCQGSPATSEGSRPSSRDLSK